MGRENPAPEHAGGWQSLSDRWKIKLTAFTCKLHFYSVSKVLEKICCRRVLIIPQYLFFFLCLSQLLMFLLVLGGLFLSIVSLHSIKNVAVINYFMGHLYFIRVLKSMLIYTFLTYTRITTGTYIHWIENFLNYCSSL